MVLKWHWLLTEGKHNEDSELLAYFSFLKFGHTFSMNDLTIPLQVIHRAKGDHVDYGPFLLVRK